MLAARCPYATSACTEQRSALRAVGTQLVACHRAEELSGGVSFTTETAIHE